MPKTTQKLSILNAKQKIMTHENQTENEEFWRELLEVWLKSKTPRSYKIYVTSYFIDIGMHFAL